jgi:hypothetical protein
MSSLFIVINCARRWKSFWTIILLSLSQACVALRDIIYEIAYIYSCSVSIGMLDLPKIVSSNVKNAG